MFLSDEACARAKAEIMELATMDMYPGKDGSARDWLAYLRALEIDCRARVKKGPKIRKMFEETEEDWGYRVSLAKRDTPFFLGLVREQIKYYEDKLSKEQKEDGESEPDYCH